MKSRILYILTLLLLATNVGMAAKKQPSWITQKPVSDEKYVGIARVELTDPAHREKATQLALAEIATQISSKVESNSLLQMIDIDGKSKELFEKSISQSVEEHLEGQKMVDSYETSTHYYVYYELDIKKYEKLIEDRRTKAVNDGFDMYAKGRAADDTNNLANAALLYANGLELIEPYLNLSLTMDYNGVQVDVANELYNAFLNVYSGLALVSSAATLPAEAFKAVGEPIVVCLSRNGVVVPNMKINAEFKTGGGEITPSTMTNYEGVASFYVTNVTSKDAVQSVEISIDDSALDALPETYRAFVESSTPLPTAMVNIALTNNNYAAIFKVGNNDIEECESHIKTIFGNNYFELTTNADAEILIDYSTEFEVGEIIAGEISDFNECFCTLTIKISDNKTKKQLLQYSIPKERVLVPTTQSVPQAMQSCARTLVLRSKKELPIVLKKLNLNN